MKRAALLITAFTVALPAAAQAQCPDGAAVCAEVNVGGVFAGSVRVGRRRVPRAQVIVQPAPPPPRGRVVVVTPAPPPPPPPPPQQTTTVVVETEETYDEEYDGPVVVRVRPDFRQKFGVNFRLSTMLANNVRMGGGNFALRLRPSRIFAFEFGVGGFGGTDFNGMDRVEIPLTFSAMFFLPRTTRFQMYLLTGLGYSWASTDGYHEGYEMVMNRQFSYFGGHAGIGGEWRVKHWLGLSVDVRGFIRTNLFNDGRPEFYDRENNRESDTSVGALASIGGTIYW